MDDISLDGSCHKHFPVITGHLYLLCLPRKTSFVVINDCLYLFAGNNVLVRVNHRLHT